MLSTIGSDVLFLILDLPKRPRSDMTLSKLQEDLLNDFKEQKQILIEQIEIFDPLATSLRRPAAQRLASKTGLIILEIISYLLAMGALAFAVVMNLVYPFNMLTNVRFLHSASELKALQDAEYFSIAVHCMAAFTGILFFIIARMTRRIRLKNNILSLAGKNMKTLVGQHLKRKAAMEAVEQRHLLDLPSYAGDYSVNAIPNPAYDVTNQ